MGAWKHGDTVEKTLDILKIAEKARRADMSIEN